MNITFQANHFTASAHLQQFAKDKAAKLYNHSDEIIRIDITLYEGGTNNHENQFCEMYVSVPGNNHFVKKNSAAYEQSILESVEALEKIMRRKKETEISDRRREADINNETQI